MKEILRLTKLFLNESIGLSLFSYNAKHNKKEFYKQLAIMIIAGIGIIYFAIAYVVLVVAAYFGLDMLNQTMAFLSMGYIFASVLILVFGIMPVLSEFYFSNNLEKLIHLPIHPQKLILSKFLSILALEMIFAAGIFLPIVIVYGVGQGMGPIYYLLSLLVCVTIPILPLSILTALTMLIMRSVAGKGRKDVVQVVFATLIIAVFLGIQFFIMSNSGLTDEGASLQIMLTNILANSEQFLYSTAHFFPSAFLVAWALNKVSFLSIMWVLLLMGITGFFVALMVFIGDRIYVRSIVSGRMEKKGKRLSVQQQNKAIGKKNGVVRTVFLMELRLLLRTPIYFFNYIVAILIVPLCIFFALQMLETEIPSDAMRALQGFLNDRMFIAVYAFVAFFVFLAGAATSTATSFSREGKESWLMRIVPLSARDQIFGRCGVGLLLQGLSIAGIVAALQFTLQLRATIPILSIILGVLAVLPVTLIGLFIDMKRPRLNWENPQKAVKNNFNPIFAMMAGSFFGMFHLGITGIIGYFVNPILGYGLFVLIAVGTSYLLYVLIHNQWESSLLKFE